MNQICLAQIWSHPTDRRIIYAFHALSCHRHFDVGIDASIACCCCVCDAFFELFFLILIVCLSVFADSVKRYTK